MTVVAHARPKSPGAYSLGKRLTIIIEDENAPQTVDALLVGTAAGDRESFSSLYDELSPLVFGMAVKTTKSRALAEDVTQETFLQVWRQADRFDPERGSARAWVATIAHRRAVDLVRRSQASSDREDKVPPEGPTSDVAELVIGEEDQRRVRSALDALTDLQREAIELAYFGGLTYREVAQRLGTPLGTVKTRMRDGLARMRTTMGGSNG